MSRIKIEVPEHFTFKCTIPVRITDINYGNHVGNDALLSLIHEARMQYLNNYGYSELNFEDSALIMSDAGIEFKNELFYGDIVVVSVTAGNFSRVGFDIFYKLEKKHGDKTILVSLAKTGMVCFDYKAKKITSVPIKAMTILMTV